MKTNPIPPRCFRILNARLQRSIVAAGLLLCVPAVLAQSVPTAINYQGILLNGQGEPITAITDVQFRIYDTPAEPTGLKWGRMFRITPDTSGAFNVVLSDSGAPVSDAPTNASLASVFTGVGSDSLFLELTVAGSTPIRPRQQFVAAPYAFLANGLTSAARQNFTVNDTLTVIGQAALGSLNVSGAVTAYNSTVTASNFVGFGTIPIGGIIMWSGPVANIPAGWALCNGTQGTPDLQDRFIVGAGRDYAVGDAGGNHSVVLTANQVPLRAHTHDYYDKFDSDYENIAGDIGYNYGATDQEYGGDGVNRRKVSYTTTSTSILTVEAHENRPPYYALAYIMRIR